MIQKIICYSAVCWFCICAFNCMPILNFMPHFISIVRSDIHQSWFSAAPFVKKKTSSFQVANNEGKLSVIEVIDYRGLIFHIGVVFQLTLHYIFKRFTVFWCYACLYMWSLSFFAITQGFLCEKGMQFVRIDCTITGVDRQSAIQSFQSLKEVWFLFSFCWTLIL